MQSSFIILALIVTLAMPLMGLARWLPAVLIACALLWLAGVVVMAL